MNDEAPEKPTPLRNCRCGSAPVLAAELRGWVVHCLKCRSTFRAAHIGESHEVARRQWNQRDDVKGGGDA